MIKYLPETVSIVMEEIPNKVSLAISITNCSGKCQGCHSPYLREDIGEELTTSVIDALIEDNLGINNFLFLGEGRDIETICRLAKYIKDKYQINVSLYSGRTNVESILFDIFDFIKVGPYIPDLGSIDKITTNQRLYKIDKVNTERNIIDITYLFWNRIKKK